MSKSFFITRKTTVVGKTWATRALMHYFKNKGLSVVGMKPVAAGCVWQDGQLKNADAMLMQENATLALDYKEINPYAFEIPVSPHIAAKDNPVILDVITKAFCDLKDKADVVLVEGAGGWLAPLNMECDIADLAKVLQIPVIMQPQMTNMYLNLPMNQAPKKSQQSGLMSSKMVLIKPG